jgi:RHS repeat-associated protein
VGGALPPSRIRRNQVYCYYSERYGATGRAAIFYVYDGSRPRPGGGDGLSKGAQRATEGSSESEGRTATSGNVAALVDAADGSVVARYDYSPFGMTVLVDGPAAAANPWRFSTKYHDSETSLVYYGYRYYSPELGRWINRDPIGENGGLSIYSFLDNRSVGAVDFLGLKWAKKCQTVCGIWKTPKGGWGGGCVTACNTYWVGPGKPAPAKPPKDTEIEYPSPFPSVPPKDYDQMCKKAGDLCPTITRTWAYNACFTAIVGIPDDDVRAHYAVIHLIKEACQQSKKISDGCPIFKFQDFVVEKIEDILETYGY